MPPLLLWAQQVPKPAAPTPLQAWLQWLLVWGEPAITDARAFGWWITWAKYVGLFSLLTWLVVFAFNSLRASASRAPGHRGPVGRTTAFLAVLGVLFLLSILIQVLEQTERIRLIYIGNFSIGTAITTALGLVFLAWMEWVVWRGAARSERRAPLVLAGLMHLAIGAGLAVSFAVPEQWRLQLFLSEGLWSPEQGPAPAALRGFSGAIIEGLRIGATYAGLIVLAYIVYLVIDEARQIRWRRLYSIAWQTVVESYRRMWAPWVVLAMFVVILAFTSWFLQGQRTAELAKVYVGTLSVVISLLLTLMILILAPISIPNDIQQQTIYTVVSKPVRRLELIWGRLLGYMVLVTAVLLVFGGISMFYLYRVVYSEIGATRREAQAALAAGRIEEARRLDEQASQLRARMSARVPLFGVLSFTDSRGIKRSRGIDVGMEQVTRSHIEGATPSKATWRYGLVPDEKHPGMFLDRRLPVDQLLRPGSIEDVENRLVLARDDLARLQLQRRNPNLKTSEAQSLNDSARQLEERVEALDTELKDLQRRETEQRQAANALKGQGKADEASAALREIDEELHSPAIPIEMTFNVYRTTKGELGEAVRASVVVTNPVHPEFTPARDLFPVHEYFTIHRTFPARMLVGSRGELKIDVSCVTPDQYLGMAEEDLYVLAAQGSFWTNYLRGLSGLWLQALVLASVGLFAGTFLSWPVALLLTLAFYMAGQVAIGFLQQFVTGGLIGGGPVESLIRLLFHNNQMDSLDPTLGVVLAKTFDQIFLPFMSRLTYLIPNLSALDVSNQVALGFAVDNQTLFTQLLLGVGYALPFTIAAYFILKNREVAA